MVNAATSAMSHTVAQTPITMARECSRLVERSLGRLQSGNQQLSLAALLKALTSELGQYIGQMTNTRLAEYANNLRAHLVIVFDKIGWNVRQNAPHTGAAAPSPEAIVQLHSDILALLTPPSGACSGGASALGATGGQGGGGGGTGSMKGPYSSRHVRAMESRLSQARG